MSAVVATAQRSAPIKIKPEFPAKAKQLFLPAPYKVMHGGRGGSKSWDMARALLVLGMNRRLFIVCGREIQRSIKESVHKLLSDQIAMLGMAGFYDIKEAEIVGRNGTRFVFVGVRNNITAIKSMEAIDVMWLTEATHIPNTSWDILLPTVRRDPPFGPFGKGSEVWIDFNPELSSDDTYVRWVIDPPEGTIVVEVNWRDNPWFPEILRKQKDELLRRDQDAYMTVWEGKTRKALEGAIYAKEIAAAVMEKRVSPYIKVDRSRGVAVVFDLGRADMCSLWFMQQIGMDHNAVDHYSNCGFGIDHYLQEIQQRKYLISGIWLPPDAKQHHQSAARSIEKQVRDVYRTPGIVKIIPRVRIATRISYLRALFPRMNFNEKTCSAGLLSLQHYQYAVKAETGQRSREPLHNWASHDADSLGGYAVQLREGNRKEEEREVTEQAHGDASPQGWMM